MRTTVTVCGILALSCVLPVMAQTDPFQPERVTVAPPIGKGPHLFAASGNRLHLIDPQTFKYHGQITFSPAYGNKLALAADGDTLYVTSTYFSRPWAGTRKGGTGVREDVVIAYDTSTLEPLSETKILPKNAATVGISKAFSGLSADGRWLVIQNATPATSVTVVDTRSRKQTAEIPAPGCWGVYPSATNAQRFSALCGDGKIMTFTLAADGSRATSTVSDKIFDAGTDPLFVDAVRDGDTLMFMSFNGNAYQVSLADAKARLLSKFSITEGVKGKWAPGGTQLLAYLPGSDILYVLMHDKPYNGSQVEPAKELWAVDMKQRKLVSRTNVKPLRAITVMGGDQPLLFGFGDGEMSRYEINKSAGYTVRHDEALKMGDGASFLEVR